MTEPTAGTLSTTDATPILPAVRTYLSETPNGVPVVAVHGRSRRAGDQFRALLPAAMAADAVLIAPLFTSSAYPAYQRLDALDRPWGAADDLLSTLDRLSEQHPISVGQVDLVGFSGGAQFVHRFAMRHPDRVRRLVVTAAGWYTLLDEARRYPHGVADRDTGAPLFDVAAFLALPILVMVGERDVEPDAGLRTSARLDRVQGENRLQRALHWVDHLEEEGRRQGISTAVSFDVLPGCGHSFAQAATSGYAERTMAFLTSSTFPVIEAVGDAEIDLPGGPLERER